MSSTTVAQTPPPWLPIAAKYIGFHETGDNRGIQHFIDLAHTGEEGDPYCAIFANAVLEEAGFPGTRSAAARSFERSSNFIRLDGPALGAIVTRWRGSPTGGQGHVYFYLGENQNGNIALGGNQSDSVDIEYQPQSPVTGYWWPRGWQVPPTGSIHVDESVALRTPTWSAAPVTMGPAKGSGSGKGSWYSQYSGKYEWRDTGDTPGSNALGVPDDCQGCSFLERSTLGKWFSVTAPNGKTLVRPQTDIGPAARTGRKIDISAAMAEDFGYSPKNFPTDGTFTWVQVEPPAGLAGLSPAQQAIQFRRQGSPPPAQPPLPGPTPPPEPPTSAGFDLRDLMAQVDNLNARVVRLERHNLSIIKCLRVFAGWLLPQQ